MQKFAPIDKSWHITHICAHAQKNHLSQSKILRLVTCTAYIYHDSVLIFEVLPSPWRGCWKKWDHPLGKAGSRLYKPNQSRMSVVFWPVICHIIVQVGHHLAPLRNLTFLSLYPLDVSLRWLGYYLAILKFYAPFEFKFHFGCISVRHVHKCTLAINS